MDMEWKKISRIYRDFALLVHLGIFTMVFLAILPVAIKGTAVENVGDTKWYFDGDNVIMDVPVTIKNGGVYDINNINVKFIVSNNSAIFVNSSQNLGDIKSRSVRTVHVKIPVNLNHIYNLEYPQFYHFFNYDTFHLNFTLDLDYLMNSVHFNSAYNGDVRWEPIVKEFTLEHPSMIAEENHTIRLRIPYIINTASYLKGNARFDGKVQGEFGTGNFSTEFALGHKYEGTLNLIFNATHAETLLTHTQMLHLNGNITIGGFSVPLKKDYLWGAPLNNLRVEVLSNGTLHYYFENDADFDLDLVITKDYYRNGTLILHQEEQMYVRKGDVVDTYEGIGVNEEVDRVVITIRDENSGFIYKKVVDI